MVGKAPLSRRVSSRCSPFSNLDKVTFFQNNQVLSDLGQLVYFGINLPPTAAWRIYRTQSQSGSSIHLFMDCREQCALSPCRSRTSEQNHRGWVCQQQHTVPAQRLICWLLLRTLRLLQSSPFRDHTILQWLYHSPFQMLLLSTHDLHRVRRKP